MDVFGPSLLILFALAISFAITFAILTVMGQDAGSKQELDHFLKDFSEWPPDG